MEPTPHAALAGPEAATGIVPRQSGGREEVAVVTGVGHVYGRGALARQVLDGIDLQLHAGEIVVLTGPSGSGKTTLLTLIGALRSLQKGNLRVLGQELAGAGTAARAKVRRGIGYVFQAHNLLDSVSARENVLLSLQLHPEMDGRERDRRAREMLAAVGLESHMESRPRQLSGGQRQRVALARALAPSPRLVLADEPTASLDAASGRAVAELLERLARQQGTSVLLVTHDSRILDVADRVVHLEDGRLVSATAAVAADTRRLLGSLASTHDAGDLMAQLAALPDEAVEPFLTSLTAEASAFLDVVQLAENAAVESMLRQVLTGLTRRIGGLLDAERATLFLADPTRRVLWSLYAEAAGGHPVRLRVRYGQGVAGWVAETGQVRNAADAYADPLFNRTVDQRTGFRTENLLAVPLHDQSGALLGVAQVLNKRGAPPGTGFSRDDEQRFAALAARLAPVLETWREMAQRRPGVGPAAEAEAGP
jgi:putative ABC transport system ATP-binding protein